MTVDQYIEEVFADGRQREFVIEHGFDTHDTNVTLHDPRTGEQYFPLPPMQKTRNTVTLSFLVPPPAGQRIRVTVKA